MNFDAVIIGAGPAGSTVALSLARKGWAVAVVEKAPFPRRKVCGEFISATSLAVIDALGVGAELRKQAGPEVKRVALYAGKTIVDAPMPDVAGSFGRALGRDVLDTTLIQRAGAEGAAIFQPAKAITVQREGDRNRVRIVHGGREVELVAPVVVAAHGSWEQGSLPSQLPKVHDACDFLGFKAHFRRATLPQNLMPLFFFPGGYGGIVWSDAGRLSLSCCIRRDALERIRRGKASTSASEAMHRHIMDTCLGVRQVIERAEREGAWLAAGPIRPGLRDVYAGDSFRVGNLAGESHPIIAEGISMAIQSGWLLSDALSQVDVRTPEGRGVAARIYGSRWRSQFALRIHVASVLARLSIHPGSSGLAGFIAKSVPGLLTLGASLSGKNRTLRMS